MSRLNIPSLQHLARNWNEDPQKIKRFLVDLANNPPNFNYTPLFSSVIDMLVLKQPYDEIVKGITRGTKRANVQENYLTILQLMHSHFNKITPDFVNTLDHRYYSIGRDLLVPFTPPLIYGIGGYLHFPWFSFWRNNPLAGDNLSLFVTIVEEMLFQDPDLETVTFTILDFSAPKQKEPRNLTVINAKDIPRISEKRKKEMLSTLAEGYMLAKDELANTTPYQPMYKRPDNGKMDDLPGLFS